MKTHSDKFSRTHSFINTFCRNSNSISLVKVEFAHTSSGIPSALVVFTFFIELTVFSTSHVSLWICAVRQWFKFCSNLLEFCDRENFCYKHFCQLVSNTSGFSIRECAADGLLILLSNENLVILTYFNRGTYFIRQICLTVSGGDLLADLPHSPFSCSGLSLRSPANSSCFSARVYLLFHLALDTLLTLCWHLWIRVH